MLDDVLGSPIRAWNDRGFTARFVYALLRPSQRRVTSGKQTVGSLVLAAGVSSACGSVTAQSAYGTSLVVQEAIQTPECIFVRLMVRNRTSKDVYVLWQHPIVEHLGDYKERVRIDLSESYEAKGLHYAPPALVNLAAYSRMSFSLIVPRKDYTDALGNMRVSLSSGDVRPVRVTLGVLPTGSPSRLSSLARNVYELERQVVFLQRISETDDLSLRPSKSGFVCHGVNVPTVVAD